MYAVIKTGGKQYRVEVGDLIDIELIDGELGETVNFSEVLLVADGQDVQVGAPQVADYVVRGKLVDYVGGSKIHSAKYRKRKRSYRKWGHRQYYARVEVESIAIQSVEE